MLVSCRTKVDFFLTKYYIAFFYPRPSIIITVDLNYLSVVNVF